jgi:hypothetical protein
MHYQEEELLAFKKIYFALHKCACDYNQIDNGERNREDIEEM